jgi:hypothetical protein
MLFVESNHAWNIGRKIYVSGPVVHTTYFLTPNNASAPVTAQAYVGLYLNGVCQYNAVYPIGKENLKTGDLISIDGYQLMALVGPNYNCMTIQYMGRQQVAETFQLLSDGINYVSSIPAQVEVAIL